MNEKKIIKSVLPILIAIIAIFAIALIGGAVSKKDKTPMVSNANGVFFNADDIELTNKEMYNLLKNQSGLSTLVELMNKELMSNSEIKNENDKTFLEAVSDADIEEELKTQSKAEKLEDSDEKWVEFKEQQLISLGLKTETEIKAYYRLSLAMKAYTRSQIKKDYTDSIADDDVTDTITKDNIEEYYNTNYHPSFWTIVIKYTTEAEMKKALKQLGIEIKNVPTEEEVITVENGHWVIKVISAYDKETGKYTYSSRQETALVASETDPCVITYDDDNQILINGNETNVTAKTASRWIWVTTTDIYGVDHIENDLLTYEEVKKAYISLYNTSVASKAPGYPNTGNEEKNNTVTVANGQYSIVDGKIVFNTTLDETEDSKKNTFFMDYETLNGLSSTVYSYVNTTLGVYSAADYIDKDDNVITSLDEKAKANSYSISGKTISDEGCYLAFKIAVDEADVLYQEDEDGNKLTDADKNYIFNDTVKNEILEKMFDEKATDTEIVNRMATLRYKTGLKIYDESFDKAYNSKYTSDYKSTKATSSKDVAKLGDTVYTADALFTELADRYGTLVALDTYQYESILRNSEYNTVYKYTGKESDKNILDKTKWKEVQTNVTNLKASFYNNSFSSYGYDAANYSWEEFIKAFCSQYYGVNVNNIFDLKMYYVYTMAVSKYRAEVFGITDPDNYTLKDEKGKEIESLTDVKDPSTVEITFGNEYSKKDLSLWETIFLPAMQKIKDEFISANGVHFLIFINDEEGNPLDPEEWEEDYKKEYAKELYDIILAELAKTTPSNYATKLSEIVTAYDETPLFVGDKGQDIPSQPSISDDEEKTETYKYSKYKSAGLLVKTETLDSIVTGQMVEPFEAAVKEIWESNLDNYGTDTTINEITIYDKTFKDYLVTEFGYHVFFTTSTTNYTTEIFPTLENALRYASSTTDTSISTEQNTAITTYFNAINTEVAGSNYYQFITMLNAKNDVTKFNFPTTSKANENNTIGRVIDYFTSYYYDQFTYIKDYYNTDGTLKDEAKEVAEKYQLIEETHIAILEAVKGTHNANVTLPNSNTTTGATITWDVKDNNYINADGTIKNMPTEKTSVVFTATITVGTLSYKTNVVIALKK